MRTFRKEYVCDLLTYRIHDGLLEEWLRVWRSDVRPLREEHGFRVLYAYAERNRSLFTWVLCSDAEDERERSNRYWTAQLASGVNPIEYIAEHWSKRERTGNPQGGPRVIPSTHAYPPEPTNTDRADRARAAVTTYVHLTRWDDSADHLDDPDVVEEVVSDLICDLCHALRIAGLDPEPILKQAHADYTDERLDVVPTWR